MVKWGLKRSQSSCIHWTGGPSTAIAAYHNCTWLFQTVIQTILQLWITQTFTLWKQFIISLKWAKTGSIPLQTKLWHSLASLFSWESSSCRKSPCISDPRVYQVAVASIFTKNCFFQLTNYLHVSPPTEVPAKDYPDYKGFGVKPLLTLYQEDLNRWTTRIVNSLLTKQL